jgi:hypothetical protein
VTEVVREAGYGAGPRIAYVCTAPAHLEKNGPLADHLTIKDKDWAYCPLDVRAGVHDWSPTGGISLTEIELLVRGMRERNGQNGTGQNS